VGFLPVAGAAAPLGPIATGAAASLLAASAALVQPRAGAALDHGRITTTAGIRARLGVTAAGLAAAMLPGLTGMLLAAVLIGAGTGAITPLGFAALAASSPPERLGQTMGAAELCRELSDPGGPVLVAGVATATTLTGGFAALAALTASALWTSRPAATPHRPPHRTAPHNE
jgi:MFS family permease